jgi:hypothetical protein
MARIPAGRVAGFLQCKLEWYVAQDWRVRLWLFPYARLSHGFTL